MRISDWSSDVCSSDLPTAWCLEAFDIVRLVTIFVTLPRTYRLLRERTRTDTALTVPVGTVTGRPVRCRPAAPVRRPGLRRAGFGARPGGARPACGRARRGVDQSRHQGHALRHGGEKESRCVDRKSTRLNSSH